MNKEFDLYLKSEPSESLNKAYCLVKELFKDRKDKNGNPYIEHLLYVCNRVDTKTEKIVALLHDVIEDTHITEKDLKDFGFENDIIEAVKILTKSNTITYKSYIDKIIKSENLIALKVKYQDLLHNSDENRLKKLDPFTAERLRRKYKKVIPKIQRTLKKERK